MDHIDTNKMAAENERFGRLINGLHAEGIDVARFIPSDSRTYLELLFRSIEHMCQYGHAYVIANHGYTYSILCSDHVNRRLTILLCSPILTAPAAPPALPVLSTKRHCSQTASNGDTYSCPISPLRLIVLSVSIGILLLGIESVVKWK